MGISGPFGIGIVAEKCRIDIDSRFGVISGGKAYASEDRNSVLVIPFGIFRLESVVWVNVSKSEISVFYSDVVVEISGF